MPRSHYHWQRNDAFWPKAPAVSATQVVVLLAVAVAVIFSIDRALDASRSPAATGGDAAVSASGNCPQLADTFDSERAACLRRRWSAMRDMKPWPDAPQNAVLEDCLRSSSGEVAVPFKANSCGNPKTSPRQQRAQN